MPYVVVAYDTPSAERRRELLARSRGALFHVQRSVFEGQLRPSDVRRLHAALAAVVDRRRDRVRLFELCPSCASRSRSLAGTQPRSRALLTLLSDE